MNKIQMLLQTQGFLAQSYSLGSTGSLSKARTPKDALVNSAERFFVYVLPVPRESSARARQDQRRRLLFRPSGGVAFGPSDPFSIL